jgi:hypothetical protein
VLSARDMAAPVSLTARAQAQPFALQQLHEAEKF